MKKVRSKSKVGDVGKSVKRPSVGKTRIPLIKRLKTKDVVLKLIANGYNIDKTARDLRVSWDCVNKTLKNP